ncbi:class II aldolase/adducin family protein [Falsigemmobacter faecalis]|uniref:Class II aldolase/adducin family protein n=1 Tax=Falsigemmobacter faecalis TaxID=2488730 RepID=A0A3P3DQ14_9RHOB|nr:class II aldolase/adducin family protein [Falsigemmobacter faecalis]
MARFEAEGLNHGSSGNISVRAGSRTLITPAGARAANLTPERIVALDIEGALCDGGADVPSTEWRIHTEIYRARPEVMAVVHSHADNCVALSCHHRPLPPFHYMIAGFGGDEVPCARYQPLGSDALAFAVTEALGARYKACLMASHGMVAVGTSLSQASDLTVKLEMLARQYLLARQAGEPVLLSEDELREVHRRYGYYGHSRMPR